MSGFGYNVNGFGSGGSGASGLYEFTSAQFLPASVGRNGPSLSQARAGLTGTGVNAWKNNTQFFNTSSGIMSWVVPADGDYRIEVWGASGGQYQGNGGYGARMRGDFSFSSGQVIKILVGQTGANTYGGGGGGTFVTRADNVAFIVAGGGNAKSAWNTTLRHGSTGTSGTDGSRSGAAGQNGNGGSSIQGVWGGAGYLSDAQDPNNNLYYSTKPLSFLNGGVGGLSCNGEGGFGGGSATDGCVQGASPAGGGYSGGGGTNGSGNFGGAGGSYNNGSNQSNTLIMVYNFNFMDICSKCL